MIPGKDSGRDAGLGCRPGGGRRFSSTVDGNSLSDDEQVAKLELIVRTADRVWG